VPRACSRAPEVEPPPFLNGGTSGLGGARRHPQSGFPPLLQLTGLLEAARRPCSRFGHRRNQREACSSSRFTSVSSTSVALTGTSHSLAVVARLRSCCRASFGDEREQLDQLAGRSARKLRTTR